MVHVRVTDADVLPDGTLRDLSPETTSLDCSECVRLRKIPYLPLLETLYCLECTALVEIPILPELRELWCWECVALVDIPILPKLRMLNCEMCTALVEIPFLPKLRMLNCEMCTALVEIPFLPELRWLCCKRCPNLRRFAQMLGRLDVFDADFDMSLEDRKRRDAGIEQLVVFIWIYERWRVPDDLARLARSFLY